MIANPFTTTAQKAVIVVLLVVLVALGAAAGMLWLDLRSMRSNLDECKLTSAGLAARLDVQNAAVQSWQRAASDAQDSASKALALARSKNAAQAPEIKRLADLLAAGKVTDCGAAMSEIREGLR